MPPRLLSLLPCCVQLSFHTGPRAPTLYFAWALKARYQFGRSGKHDVGHVGGDVTNAGAIREWRLCANHRVRNLASKVRVSHQPSKVGQLRSFLGTVSLLPVWYGPEWDTEFRVYGIAIQLWCLKGPADINAADESAVRLLCQDIIQTYLSLAAVGALERIGHAIFGGVK